MFHPINFYLPQQQVHNSIPILSFLFPRMDAFGPYTNSSRVEKGVTKRAASSAKKKLKKKRNDPLKIVYISSPMKVWTCESEFRSLVQQLTGKDSQVAMFMEVSSSHVAEETCQPVVSDSTTSPQVAGVEDKTDLFEQWPVSSDQSFSAAEENYVMDENLAVGGGGGGGYGFGMEFDWPWHLLVE